MRRSRRYRLQVRGSVVSMVDRPLKRHARPGESDEVVTRPAGLPLELEVKKGSPFSPCELIRSWSLGKGALTLTSSAALSEGVVACGDWFLSRARNPDAAVAAGDAWKRMWLGRPLAVVCKLGLVTLSTLLLP